MHPFLERVYGADAECRGYGFAGVPASVVAQRHGAIECARLLDEFARSVALPLNEPHDDAHGTHDARALHDNSA